MTAPITGRPARAGFALLLALVWTCFAASAGAQSPATAAVRGRVTDASGALIAGATITIASPTTGVTRTARSGSDGAYTIADVPLTGAYTLTVTRDGFATQQKGPFTLAGSQTANFDVTLAPAGVSEEIRVSGTFDGVRADAPQLGTRFDTQKIRETPLLGNKLTTVPLLNSAVRSARGTGDLFLNETLFVVDGGGRRQTTFTIDGSSSDDSWGRQTVTTSLPLAAVQEMNVLTSAFSAEYGRTTGGAINLVTKSGTSAIHVDATGLYRPGSLSADQPVTGTSGYDNLWQGSGIISGPIVADRVYFSIGGRVQRGQPRFDDHLAARSRRLPRREPAVAGLRPHRRGPERPEPRLRQVHRQAGSTTRTRRTSSAASPCRAPAANSPATPGRRSWRTRRASRPRSSTTCASSISTGTRSRSSSRSRPRRSSCARASRPRASRATPTSRTSSGRSPRR